MWLFNLESSVQMNFIVPTDDTLLKPVNVYEPKSVLNVQRLRTAAHFGICKNRMWHLRNTLR